MNAADTNTRKDENFKGAMELMKIVADAIRSQRSLGVARGELFAILMPFGVTLEAFESLEALLVKSGLIEKRNHRLTWIANF